MGAGTLIRYLLGDRRAILELAANPRTVVVGLLFVLSAGFAREYDGADLLHEPWHLLIPLAASLASSFLLFNVAWLRMLFLEGPRPRYLTAYVSFLGVFWMTAPLAWLYAVPYERFLSPVAAVRANLLTLALVSAWRVALMVRVFVVLMGYRVVEAVCLVLAFADGTALLALWSAPFPLLSMMGGVRLSEGEQLLRETALDVFLLGFCSAPVWFLAALLMFFVSRPTWQTNPGAGAGRPSLALWALALGSVGVWAAVLPITQPEQQLCFRVEREFRQGQIGDALAEMSRHPRSDFPPHWDPPPREISVWDGVSVPLLHRICQEMIERPAADWVRRTYVRKLQDLLQFGHLPDKERGKLERVLHQLEEE